jgi:hypothetical protein
MSDFFNSGPGRQFICGTMPRIAEGLERVAWALENNDDDMYRRLFNKGLQLRAAQTASISASSTTMLEQDFDAILEEIQDASKVSG